MTERMRRTVARRTRRRIAAAALAVTGVVASVASVATSEVAGAANKPHAATKGTLTVGIVADPPFILQTPSGQWVSLAPTLDRMFAAYLHMKIQFVPTGFSTAIAALQANKFDMFGADFHATPEREKVVNFSTPFNVSGTTWWVRKDSSKHLTSLASLNSADVSIALITGSDNQTATQKYMPKAHQVLLPNASISDLLLQLESGKVDAFGESSYLVPALAQKYPQLRAIPNNTTGLLALGQGWVFNKSQTKLLHQANAFMHKVIADGELAKLKKKYVTLANSLAS